MSEALTPLSAEAKALYDDLVERITYNQPRAIADVRVAILDDFKEAVEAAIRAPLEAKLAEVEATSRRTFHGYQEALARAIAAERVFMAGGTAEYHSALDAWRALAPAAALAGVPRHEDWVTAFLAEHDARAANNDWHPAILPAYHRAQTEGIEWLPDSAESFDAVVAWTLRNLSALAGVPKEAAHEA